MQAAQPDMQPEQLTLALTSEKAHLSASLAHTLSVLISMKAPDASPATRQPLELVAVVDRSGSMSGAKMKAMKEALMFLVNHGLQKDDCFALVAFDNQVELRLPVLQMDAAGKKQALEMVTALNTGGATNLSGGLLKGIDVLSQAKGGANTNKAVLLFTDGIANNGITDSAGIVAAAHGAMVASPMTVFTFGFGGDHTESLLRSLAEDTNGLYYYVDKSEDIPTSFADCLGGLVSVVAQNAVLRVEGLDGSRPTKAHCHYKQESTGSDGAIALQLGDIYAEDEKDVLLSVAVPALAAALLAPNVALRATLRYFSVSKSQVVEISVSLELGRPQATPEGQVLPPRLAEQRERITVAEAMSTASEMADRGQIAEGRLLLQTAVAHAQGSAAAASPIVRGLVSDAMALDEGYSDQARYRSHGSKMSKSAAMSHMQQRSTHSSAQTYERKSKMAMKSAFASSASSSASLRPSISPSSSSSPPSSPTATRSAPTTTATKKRTPSFFSKLPTLHSLSLSPRSSVDLS